MASWLEKWRQATKHQRWVMSVGELHNVIEEAEEELRTLRQRIKAADRLRDAVSSVHLYSHLLDCNHWKDRECSCGKVKLRKAIEDYDKAGDQSQGGSDE